MTPGHHGRCHGCEYVTVRLDGGGPAGGKSCRPSLLDAGMSGPGCTAHPLGQLLLGVMIDRFWLHAEVDVGVRGCDLVRLQLHLIHWGTGVWWRGEALEGCL